MCCTSSPYWGLRDYGLPSTDWPDGWRGCLGLEPTPEMYVAHMAAVFREVRRVLRDDGTLWLNLGDCYATGAGKVGECPGGGEQGERWAGRSAARGERTRALRDGRNAGKHTAISAMGPMTQPNRMPLPGLKPKDLVGIPWRVAFALQADGWWLRSDIVWHKPNPMPESVRDRPTKAHEYVFLLSKSADYFYDAEAVAEPAGDRPARKTGPGSRADNDRDPAHAGRKQAALGKATYTGFNERYFSGLQPTTRNKRSVWTIATQPYRGAHFAAMPEVLAEPCVLAGSRPGDLVLDPFGGTGTVGRVAVAHQRRAVLCDLSATYLRDLATERTRNVQIELLAGGAR